MLRSSGREVKFSSHGYGSTKYEARSGSDSSGAGVALISFATPRLSVFQAVVCLLFRLCLWRFAIMI